MQNRLPSAARRVTPLVLGALVALPVLSACGKKAPMGPPPLSVDAAAATRQNIATYLTLDGQIAPLEQSTLAFQQSGTITHINVNIGDMVHKGICSPRSIPRPLRRSSRRPKPRRRSSPRPRRARSPATRCRRKPTQRRCRRRKRRSRTPSSSSTKTSSCTNKATSPRRTLQQSQANYVSAQQTYNNAVVGLRNNGVSYQNVKSQQAQRTIGCGASPRAEHAALADLPLRSVRRGRSRTA